MGEIGEQISTWKRPNSVDYPKVWHTFKARDVDSDDLVEYRIQDLPESRVEDVFHFLWINYLKEEPIGVALGGANDLDYFDDFKQCWIPSVQQRLALICFKNGSDEIVGVNMNYVKMKNHSRKKLYDESKSQVSRDFYDIVIALFDYDPFERYGVDSFLSSSGLSVAPKYQRRGIAQQFLLARKPICHEFGLKLTQTVFTSDFASRSADKVGFVTDAAIKYKDLVDTKPQLANVKSDEIVVKTLLFEQ